MISTGIVRSIDNLGRVVLPKELRNTYSITPDTRWRFSPMGNPLCCASTVPKAPVYSAARFRPTQFCCTGSIFARPAARHWGNKASIKSKAGHPRWMLCLFFVSVLLAGEPCLPLHFLWGNGFILPFSARA